ncbi:nucleoside-diphosphate sugar epimerase [Sediminicola sp. YIK13]|uniref:NmrA/HSCARG family protein n=1 Tax=Sediminicola sp. YIK13 TaxID=1453352 RepID=UPI00071F5521|nr:NmrA/HSCARG family protein [Sediminicola sp. YIK13]ALM09040.1 nucleoside-diphosphate sugar epimerase [Sediminicola sp. YIK13]
MENRKIIAVVGATGAQGGGLVLAILNDGSKEFEVRGISRDITSAKAKELSKLGAQMVQADLDNKSSLVSAFKGAHGVYCVTNFWEHMSPEKEMAQAKNMAEAAKEAGVQHVVWSTLEDTRKWIPLSDKRMPTLMGNYKVPHFDAKGASNSYFEKSGVPYTFLLTSFYWENFINFGMGPQKDKNGKLSIALPMGNKKLPGIAVDDIGKCAYGIFKAGKKYQEKTVGICGDQLTVKEMATAFSNVFGTEIGYSDVPVETYRKLEFPGADDLGNMFQFNQEFETDFCRARDLKLAKELNPELLSFEAWLRKNKNRLEPSIRGEAATA